MNNKNFTNLKQGGWGGEPPFGVRSCEVVIIHPHYVLRKASASRASCEVSLSRGVPGIELIWVCHLLGGTRLWLKESHRETARVLLQFMTHVTYGCLLLRAPLLGEKTTKKQKRKNNNPHLGGALSAKQKDTHTHTCEPGIAFFFKRKPSKKDTYCGWAKSCTTFKPWQTICLLAFDRGIESF